MASPQVSNITHGMNVITDMWQFRAAMAACILGNVFWYIAKFTVGSHGFAISYIWHFRDLPNLYRLIRQEAPSAERTWHICLLILVYLSGVAFVTLWIVLLLALPSITSR